MEMLKAAVDRDGLGFDPDANYRSFQEQLRLLRKLAKAYNRRSIEGLSDYLSDDVEYNSQASMEPVCGKADVLVHLQGRFEISRNGPHDIYAQIGYCGKEWGRVRFLGWDGRPCILVSTCYGCTPIGLIAVDVGNGLINAIDVCLAVPDPAKAEQTGEYPE